MTISNWLWLGFIAMAIGSVVLLAMGWGRRSREEENDFFLHLFVCLTAMASYLVMALGAGDVTLTDGRVFYYARYIDWAITTPMLLLGLSLTAVSVPFRRWAVVLGVMFTDVYMIVTGLFAGLSPAGSDAKWLWYLISCGAFAFIYVAIWGPLRAEAVKSGTETEKFFKAKATQLSVLWFIYPIVFLFGSEGTGAISALGTAAAYTVLDVVTKVAYGIFALAGGRRKAAMEREAGLTPDHDLRPAPGLYHEVHAPGPDKRVGSAASDAGLVRR